MNRFEGGGDRQVWTPQIPCFICNCVIWNEYKVHVPSCLLNHAHCNDSTTDENPGTLIILEYMEIAAEKVGVEMLGGRQDNSHDLLKPTGHVMQQQFNIQQLYALPHTVFMCFVFVWEQTANCATYSINWLVFVTRMKSVYSAVRTGALNKAVCASSLWV